MLKHKTFAAFISLVFLIGSGVTTNTFAGEQMVWEISSRAELLKGDARGVSVTDTGILTLAPSLIPLFSTEQAYVCSTAIDASGNIYLRTGHDGKLFRVSE